MHKGPESVIYGRLKQIWWQITNKASSQILLEEPSMSSKPKSSTSMKEVTYSNDRWHQLSILRIKAAKLLETFENIRLQAIVHGSIARGDVKSSSDIDIFLPTPPSSFIIENALEQARIPVVSRTVIQATPLYAMKAYLEIDSATTVSFPLMSLRRVEREFYTFSGELVLKNLQANLRISGVDKRLMLIEPTKTGHFESSILEKEEHTARHLGISVETVKDRVHALMKRAAVGRTGVFVKKELAPDETFEMALKRLAEGNPAVRRRLRVTT